MASRSAAENRPVFALGAMIASEGIVVHNQGTLIDAQQLRNIARNAVGRSIAPVGPVEEP